MITIVIFVSSLFIGSTMIFIKIIELKHHRENILLRLIRKFDSKSNRLVFYFKSKSLQLIQSIYYIILIQAKIICKNLLDKVEQKIMKEYKARQNVIMGHKNIINKGSVSFYLKKITEQKNTSPKGKIED